MEITPRMNKNKIVELFVKNNFEIEYVGRGKYKRTFKIKSNKTYYILKVGNNVKKEFEGYKIVKKKASHSLFKIYWCEDYVCLQKFAVSQTDWNDNNLKSLRKKLNKYCSDVRPSNCGYDSRGNLKCFDIGGLK